MHICIGCLCTSLLQLAVQKGYRSLAAVSIAVPAGLATEPRVDLDDPMGSAPVTAYFQFVQQNIQQVTKASLS